MTYHPGEALLRRLELTLDAGFRLFIYDNSPDDPIVREFCGRREGSVYLTAGKNLGLGFAITTVCAHAFYGGTNALLFFDQDSVFDASTLDFAARMLHDRPDLALTHAVVTFKADQHHVAGSGADFRIVDTPLTINSGSLYFLANVRTIGWHNQTYFVDGVDYEFCLRARSRGLGVATCLGTPGFDHEKEQGDTPIRILGWSRRVRKYSPRRIVDSATANLRLTFSSALAGQWRFAFRFARILLGYCVLQVLARAVGRASEQSGDNDSRAK